MVRGSCNCGDWTFEYSGDPTAVVVCHCIPCRKTAGTNGSTNFIVPDDKYKKLSGTDLKYTRRGVSGKDVTYHDCSTCGTIMWVEAEAFAGVHIVKAGTVDDKDALDKMKVQQEIFCKDRPDCFTALSGVDQKDVS